MTDCIIIGGGVIGMLSARALMQRGVKVTIVERGPFGREASWAGGGILSPLYPWRYGDAVNQLARKSQQQYPALSDELLRISGIDPEFRKCGLLVLDIDSVEKAEQWVQNYNIDLQWFGADQAQALEPSLAHGPEQSAWMPDVAQLRNPRFLAALQIYLEKQGARLIPDAEVTQINTNNDQASGVATADGLELQADHIVIANGAWSGRLLQQMNINLQIHPIRGQMIVMEADADLLKTIILKDGHYLIPRSDGKIVVGSTVENVGFDKSTTEQAYHLLRAFATGLLPALGDAPVLKQWAGLRPGCGEGIPYICEHPEIKGLYVNAGHFRNGIVMAPASAELIADLICADEPSLNPEPYSFAARATSPSA